MKIVKVAAQSAVSVADKVVTIPKFQQSGNKRGWHEWNLNYDSLSELI